MIRDPIAVTLEPFTREEEAALFDKLDVLSIAELENYIGSAQNSLQNKALAPSWRPRVEIGLQRAEIVLVRETAAAALKAEAPPPEVVVAVKAKKAKTAKVVEAVEAADPGEALEAVEGAEPDED
jgi:hypothetical protein